MCGRIGAYLDDPVTVTLRWPPPLVTPMAVECDGEGSVRVLDGGTLVAAGTCLLDSLAMELPDPVSIPEARTAGIRCRLRACPEEHPFPTCFVCRPDRGPRDGPHILVGPVSWAGTCRLMSGIPTRHSRSQMAMSGPNSVGRARLRGGIGAQWDAAPNDLPFVLGRLWPNAT